MSIYGYEHYASQMLMFFEIQTFLSFLVFSKKKRHLSKNKTSAEFEWSKKSQIFQAKIEIFWVCLLYCTTQWCDRKIGAICAEKSSYTRVDGNLKKWRRKIPFVWTRKVCRLELLLSGADWRLVRFFRQFLHQFFSSHFYTHATKSHFSVTIRQKPVPYLSWNTFFHTRGQREGTATFLTNFSSFRMKIMLDGVFEK